MSVEEHASDFKLVALRQELALQRGRANGLGQPGWLIYDPHRHRYIRIDANACALLSLWRKCETARQVIELTERKRGLEFSLEDVEALNQFLIGNELSVASGADAWRAYSNKATGARTDLLRRTAHSYLFFRVPLWRPQRFLDRTAHFVRRLFTRAALSLFLLAGALGLYLTSRQWGTFVATFVDFVSLEGLATFGLALIGVKALHELGHAYTAHRYGCTVPTMGVAFMLLTPLLYTDVTDAWKLRDGRKRLAIDSAGIVVELGLAGVALLAWAFLDDGPARSTAFALATVSLFMSLAINLNPFMRFDGYYLLSELLNVENLQSRSFALGRWFLREALFGLGEPAPEEISRRLRAALIAYAYCTWIYRALLFISIALIVYHFFFKLLGIFLFALEIIYFIAMPVWSELKQWWHRRRVIVTTQRSLATAVILAAGITLMAVPWWTRVSVPAILRMDQLAEIYPRAPGRIEEITVRHGDKVRAGEVMYRLGSSALRHRIGITKTRLAIVHQRLARRSSDATDLDQSLVLESELRSLSTRLEGLDRELRDHSITAPFAGRVLETDVDLKRGQWVSPRERLALVGGEQKKLNATGYADQEDLWRIANGATGRFVPDDPTRPIMQVRVEQIAAAGVANVDELVLASVHGGPVAVADDGQGRMKPVKAQVRITMAVTDDAGVGVDGWEHELRGVVHLDGVAESFLVRIGRRIVEVLVRESGL